MEKNLKAFPAKSKKRRYCLLSLLLSDTGLQVLGKEISQERNNEIHANFKRTDNSFLFADGTILHFKASTDSPSHLFFLTNTLSEIAVQDSKPVSEDF